MRYLGYYYALMNIDAELGREDAMYNEPGRMAATGGPKAPAFFVFASNKPLDYEREDTAQQKQLLIDAYRGAGWKVPALLERVPDAGEFYLDSISRVTTDHYSKGRVVLLGALPTGTPWAGSARGWPLWGLRCLRASCTVRGVTTKPRLGSTKPSSAVMRRSRRT